MLSLTYDYQKIERGYAIQLTYTEINKSLLLKSQTLPSVYALSLTSWYGAQIWHGGRGQGPEALKIFSKSISKIKGHPEVNLTQKCPMATKFGQPLTRVSFIDGVKQGHPGSNKSQYVTKCNLATKSDQEKKKTLNRECFLGGSKVTQGSTKKKMFTYDECLKYPIVYHEIRCTNMLVETCVIPFLFSETRNFISYCLPKVLCTGSQTTGPMLLDIDLTVQLLLLHKHWHRVDANQVSWYSASLNPVPAGRQMWNKQ